MFNPYIGSNFFLLYTALYSVVCSGCVWLLGYRLVASITKCLIIVCSLVARMMMMLRS